MTSTLLYAFSLVAPGLLVASIWYFIWSRFRGLGSKTIARHVGLFISAGIVCLPIQEIPLGRWLFGVIGNFSLLSTGLLALSLSYFATGKCWFKRSDFAAAWLFGAAVGMVLYPLSLGLGNYDPYFLGWHSSGFRAFLIVLTCTLFLLGNRLAWLLLAAVVGYGLGLLESTNLWDYLVDPVYFFSSLAGLSWMVWPGVGLQKKGA